MKPISGKRMCEVLGEHGWTYDRTRGSHHVYLPPGGRGRPVPVPVHGNRDLPPGTQRAIMRQAGLTDADL
jgi:predicted RNA binding protein YcfA (HicA-like mRNA interferase family)